MVIPTLAPFKRLMQWPRPVAPEPSVQVAFRFLEVAALAPSARGELASVVGVEELWSRPCRPDRLFEGLLKEGCVEGIGELPRERRLGVTRETRSDFPCRSDCSNPFSPYPAAVIGFRLLQ